MKYKEMRKYIHNLMVSKDVDLIELSAKATLATGVVWVTLKGNNDIKGEDFEERYVEISDDILPIVYKDIRKKLNAVHLYELSEEEVEQLEKQIVFGSLYIADYKNTFGVDPKEVSDYADGYLEAKEMDDFMEYESFYDYICSIEL